MRYNIINFIIILYYIIDLFNYKNIFFYKKNIFKNINKINIKKIYNKKYNNNKYSLFIINKNFFLKKNFVYNKIINILYSFNILNFKYIFFYINNKKNNVNNIVIIISNKEIRTYKIKKLFILENIFINIKKKCFLIKNIFFIKKYFILYKKKKRNIFFKKKKNKNYKISIIFTIKNKINTKILLIKIFSIYKKYNSLFLYNKYYNIYLKELNKIKYNKFPIYGNLKITSYFNLKRINPITYSKLPHKGIDISIPFYTPIFAIENGIVIKSSYNKKAGNYLIINHNNLYITKYMHLSKSFVIKNNIIKSGDLIGLSGNSGMSTGPHLHFEVWIKKKVLNPLNLKFQLNF